jgi:uncharacterized protein (TIGR02246 family)
MKQLIANIFTLVAVTFTSTLWAGPIEDVTQIAAPRQQAFQQGNVENFAAAFANNAVLQSSFSPFRIEGKDAIRAYYVQLFRIYPKREYVARQPISRAYGDNLVIQNGYTILNVTNEKGEPKTYDARYTTTWSKIDGRWQIVDAHVSRLPVAQ